MTNKYDLCLLLSSSSSPLHAVSQVFQFQHQRFKNADQKNLSFRAIVVVVVLIIHQTTTSSNTSTTTPALLALVAVLQNMLVVEDEVSQVEEQPHGSGLDGNG
jgi:hypothetical protein